MNIFEMLRQAKEAKEAMKDIKVIGKAGGDMVEVTMNAEYELEKVYIAPEVAQQHNAQFIADLVKAAFYDAITRLRQEIQSKMGSMMEGSDLLNLFGGNR